MVGNQNVASAGSCESSWKDTTAPEGPACAALVYPGSLNDGFVPESKRM